MNSRFKIASCLLKFFLIVNSAILLVPDKFKAFPIIGLLLTTVFYFIITKSSKTLNYRLFFISISFYLVLIMSMVYSDNFAYALRKLETSASLLGFPIIFLLASNAKSLITKNFIETLKMVFVGTVVFFLLFTFIYYFLTEPFYTLKSTFYHYHNLVDLDRINGYEIHAIYLSILVGVAMLFLLSSYNKMDRKRKILNSVLLVILLVFMVILNKKGPIIAFGLTGLFYVLKSKFRIKSMVYVVSLVGIFLLAFLYVPKFNNVNRFKELVDIEGLKSNPNSSTAIRIGIYKCSVKLALNAPIIGYGWGDVKNKLKECYETEYPNFLKKNYNSHNQFLSILLYTGIIGLSVFLFYFYYIFKFSNHNRNKLLFFLLLFFGLNMLSENILEREDGVIVFSFFINLFLFNSNTIED